jgi:hypothetical protein
MQHKKMIYPSEIHAMGLVYDANKALGIPSYRQNRKAVMKMVSGVVDDEMEVKTETDDNQEPAVDKFPKGHVALKLEEDANALRKSNFRYDGEDSKKNLKRYLNISLHSDYQRARLNGLPTW